MFSFAPIDLPLCNACGVKRTGHYTQVLCKGCGVSTAARQSVSHLVHDARVFSDDARASTSRPRATNMTSADVAMPFQFSDETRGRSYQPPLQPWELDKLEALATQVVTALADGRYVKDFGEIFVAQLNGWSGADAWAQAEQARLQGLVDVDDVASRQELEGRIEATILTVLRNARMEVERVRLSGLDGIPCAIDSSGVGSTSASSNVGVLKPTGSALAKAKRTGTEEEADVLHLAIVASLKEFDGTESEEADVTSEPACSKHEVPEKVFDARCDHRCDLQDRRQLSKNAVGEGRTAACLHSCCHCATRSPRPGMILTLVSWWRQRGIDVPPPSSGQWRFFCAACSVEPQADVGASCTNVSSLPLPFGGILLHSAQGVTHNGEACSAEEVALHFVDRHSVAESASSWTEAQLSSDQGSWVIV